MMMMQGSLCKDLRAEMIKGVVCGLVNAPKMQYMRSLENAVVSNGHIQAGLFGESAKSNDDSVEKRFWWCDVITCINLCSLTGMKFTNFELDPSSLSLSKTLSSGLPFPFPLPLR